MTNYDIHKLIYKNDIKKVKELISKDNLLLNKKGINGEYPIHIACFIGSEELIDFFLEIDKKSLLVLNQNKQTSYFILTSYPKLFLKYIKNDKKYINHVDNFNETLLINYILDTKDLDYDFIKKIKSLGGNINIPKDSLQLYKIIVNKCDIFKNIKDIFKIDINSYDQKGFTLLHHAIIKKNLNCIKNLIDLKANINSKDLFGQNSIFEFVLRFGSDEIINYFIDLNIDYSHLNNYGDTYTHLILFAYNKYPKKIVDKIINNTINFNVQNIDGNTPLHLLLANPDWKKYIDLLKNKKLNLNLINKNGKKATDFLSKKDKEIFLSNMKNITKINFDETKLIKVNEKVLHTLFTASIVDMVIYNYVILNKYKLSSLKTPYCTNPKKEITFKKVNTPIESKLNGLLPVYQKFNCLFCSDILWHNKNLYFVNPNLEDCLNNVINADHIFINLTLVNLSVNHANIIIIDNLLNTIERFDPYGTMDMNSAKDLDGFLKKLFNKVLKKKYTYLAPKDYMSNSTFQTLSNHDKINNQNFYEIGGFCLAWCYWYLEERINNPNIKQEKLINSLIKKLINYKNMSILDYIRAYADFLDKEKIKFFKKIKIHPKDYYKKMKSNDSIINIYSAIFRELISLQK